MRQQLEYLQAELNKELSRELHEYHSRRAVVEPRETDAEDGSCFVKRDGLKRGLQSMDASGYPMGEAMTGENYMEIDEAVAKEWEHALLRTTMGKEFNELNKRLEQKEYAGSHGRDTLGIFRVHQFEKVEQFCLTNQTMLLIRLCIIAKFGLNQGMSLYTFAVYRNVVAALVFAPFALLFERPVIDRNLFYTRMKYTTATFATAMCNIVPAMFFLMACILREKDLDEVLQSQTVYSNVSKGVLAKSKDLVAAFGTDDQTNICLEKTINPETQRPYTISMIQRLMHEIHFAVDPHSSSKKQSLDVIRELQKHLPIKLSPMRLRLYVPEQKFSSLSEKLNDWTASIVSKDESGSQLSIVPYITTALMDGKLGTEGRKDLFDWLSRQLSGLSNFPDVVNLNYVLFQFVMLDGCDL
ncbi:hypothetical protein TEA_005667 [Camellia sinensis var. sinensis]|uniref:Ribosome maturation protein SDO1/SBDS central domain-containing protein n=1 Tax=Camellia sinensis var. sinensis TaxID=542762 RepID=A0A4S4E3S9_CAMSN|nr:hypothetical protein TEA_005667 [Camellia sinensis var. sinensis]